jgi:Flp pilus assembly CpaF family ATPase/MinD-like ATPase involved in chromosome partitioning or flagellar assembly
MGAHSKVLSIFSSKGGVGKTLIAANLAASLRAHLNRKTALVELGPSRHDAAAMLGKTDVHLVAETLTHDSLPALIAGLRRSFDYVLIDAGSILTELAVAAFEQSNLILIVSTPDVVALHHARRTIDSLEALRFPLKMIQVIVNRAESRGNLRSAQIQESLPVAVIAEIPSAGSLVSLSVNQSIPIVISEDGGRIRDALKQLAAFLVEKPDVFVAHSAPVDRAKIPPSVSRPLDIAPAATGGVSLPTDGADPIIAMKRRIHSRLLERLDLKRFDIKALNDPATAPQLKAKTAQIALDLMIEEGGFLPSRQERERLVKEIIDEALGLGPLEDLLLAEEVSDILVNGKDQIYVEQRGKLSLTDKRFTSNDQLLTVIERIIAPLGRRIDESAPMVDARLPDGSRVNAIISPLSLKGPILSIRKFGKTRYTMDDLIRLGTLTPQMADFIRVCVIARKNLIVSGGTGSGKTTLLNVISSYIPPDERIVTIEDAAELRLDQEHWVPLESRQPNVEGKGQITIRQLFRNTLRMRPDRIIIGECRSDETLDMLQAMNTGHDGSLTTLHANSPQDVIARLDSLILMSNVDLPIRAIREQIAAAIHLIIHVARFSDGSRKVSHVTEITGMDEHADITFGDIFVFRQTGVGAHGEVAGQFAPTGYVPSFLGDLEAKGLHVDQAIFSPKSEVRSP